MPIDDTVADDRGLWFTRTFAKMKDDRASRHLSSHALLLEVDIEAAFRAGAWLSVVALSCAAVEAHLRQIETDNYNSPIEAMFGANPELQWLRDVRNEIMHAREPGKPSSLWLVEGHDITITHTALQSTAERAVRAMFRAIYGGSKT